MYFSQIFRILEFLTFFLVDKELKVQRTTWLRATVQNDLLKFRDHQPLFGVLRVVIGLGFAFTLIRYYSLENVAKEVEAVRQ